MSEHTFRSEVTNGGNVFADCTCGWSGGVHRHRAIAKDAWVAHRDGTAPVLPVPTVVHVSERGGP